MTDKKSHLSLVPSVPADPSESAGPTYTYGRDPRAVMLRLRHPSRQGQEPKVYEVVLGEQEVAWNPASTKQGLVGPARVTYRLHADGGVDIEVHDPDQPR